MDSLLANAFIKLSYDFPHTEAPPIYFVIIYNQTPASCTTMP